MRTPSDDKEKYLADCLTIEPEAIQEEFVRMPGDLAYWNAEYSRALQGALDAKAKRKQVRAVTYLATRQQLVDDGAKITEGIVDASVEADVEYLAAVLAENKAEAGKALAYGNIDSVRAKKEMLVSIGSHLREEMKHDPMIREAVAARRRTGIDGG